jgi:SAM-dependent methyltransferase
MEQINCNFCGHNESSLIHILRDIRLSLPGEFTLVQCQKCGLLYLNPQPTQSELAQHYPKEYHCFVTAIEDQSSLFVRWAQLYGLRRRCRAITRRKRQGRLLDVGCATGNFLNEMRRQDHWDVAGVEPAASAAEFARQRFGLHIFTGTLLEAAYPDASFDVVTLWDVLEHTSDPKAYLLEIYRILKPTGWIVLKLPDPSSWESKTFGPYWVGYEAPQHLYDFPPLVLERQLATIGFQNIELSRLGGDYATFMTSLGLWLSARGQVYPGRLAKALARTTAARVLSAPLFWALRSIGAGSSRLYFAQKPVGS